jgi:hypothetical protein
MLRFPKKEKHGPLKFKDSRGILNTLLYERGNLEIVLELLVI